MALQVTKAEVWAGEMPDQPGGLLNLLNGLAEAGANLEAVIARRQPDKPGSGIVYLSPVKGRKVQEAARNVGLAPAGHIGTLRIEGSDRPGVGREIMKAIAEAGVNVRGVSALSLGNKFAAYIGFDSPEDATKVARALRNVDAGAGRGGRRAPRRGMARR